MRKLKLCSAVSLAVSIFFCPSISKAEDFFLLNAAGGNGSTAVGRGPNVLNLINDLINTRSQFAPLFGQSFNASLNYGGVPDALLFSENIAQTSATLTIPATGFTKTFTGTSSSDLQHQIQDFIKSDGADEYGKFNKAINRLSANSAVDGNPEAFTAVVASDAFNRWGNNSTLSQTPLDQSPTADGEIRVDINGGASHAMGLDGSFIDLSLGSQFRFNDYVSLGLGTVFQYRTIAGAATYFVGQELGVPISIVHPVGDNSNGPSWQVTPWAFVGVGASTDEADGGVLAGGGITSSFSIRHDSFVFTLADQANYAGGIPVNVSGYRFETNVDQLLIKNGIKFAYAPPHGLYFIEAGLSLSNFLQNAAIPSYETFEAGFGFMFGEYSGFKLEYEGNFSGKYTDNGGRFSLFIAY